MKTIIAAFILFIGFACFGQEASDITTKTKEYDRNKVGKPDVRIETTYRGDAKVMVTVFRRNKEGVMALYSHTYFVNGKAVMVESDEDGNGKLNSIGVFGSGNEDVEVFTREADGTVTPVSTKKLDTVKHMRAATEVLEQQFLEKQKRLLQDEKKVGN